MKTISPFKNLKTSVSLPAATYRQLKAGRLLLKKGGVFFSDDEIYRRLFKLYLLFWRGKGRKTNSLRRYNAKRKTYEIRPLYINQVLYASLWQRALHSGESVSRMLDVAIRLYLSRLIESMLSGTKGRGLQRRNAEYWARRFQKRKEPHGQFFINYRCKTVRNRTGELNYIQKMTIIENPTRTIEKLRRI